MKFQSYKVKDIIFLAVIAAALTITGVLTMPLVMTVTLFGVRNMAAATFYGIFCVIALMKIPKPGALTLVAFFNGAVLLMMSPVMFLNNMVGALLAELVALLIFKSYNSEKAIVTAAGLFVPMTLPLSIIFSMLINGTTFEQIVEHPEISAFVCTGTILLSFAGAFLGLKISRELKKAGTLQ